MKRLCGGPLSKGDVEAEFAELSGQASGETRSLGALEVIGGKDVVLRPALQHVAASGVWSISPRKRTSPWRLPGAVSAAEGPPGAIVVVAVARAILTAVMLKRGAA